MEISIILDNKVIFEKEFKKLKDRVPNHTKMLEMESKFMNLMQNDRSIKYIYTIVASTMITTCNSSVVYAKDYSNISEKMKEGLNPIIELLAGLGYPLTYAMLIVGAIMIITGKKSKGLEVIKWACIGYIGLQFVPFLLNLLADIGREMRSM